MKRRILMAGATFFLAAATGHVMQNTHEIGAALRGVFVSAPKPAGTIVASVAPVAAQPKMAEIAGPQVAQVSTDALPDFPAVAVGELKSGVLLAARMDAVADDYKRPETDADKSYTVFGIPCGAPALTLSLGASGMLKAALSAPCHPEERVVFDHAGLSFALMTDAAGMVNVTIPVMATDAKVTASFGDGESLTFERRVADLDRTRRIAISGGADLGLNLYQDGATYGAEGFFSAGRPGDAGLTGGATLVVLGDPSLDRPMLAEVFTAADTANTVAVEAEATTTEANCGTTLRARFVTMEGGKPGMNETFVQAMPGCDAIGDLVVAPLPGWDGPLTVASRD